MSADMHLPVDKYVFIEVICYECGRRIEDGDALAIHRPCANADGLVPIQVEVGVA